MFKFLHSWKGCEVAVLFSVDFIRDAIQDAPISLLIFLGELTLEETDSCLSYFPISLYPISFLIFDGVEVELFSFTIYDVVEELGIAIPFLEPFYSSFLSPVRVLSL